MCNVPVSRRVPAPAVAAPRAASPRGHRGARVAAMLSMFLIGSLFAAFVAEGNSVPMSLAVPQADKRPGARPGLATDPFPEPAALAPAVAFWTRVYTRVDVDQGLVHDDRHLGVVYAVAQLPGEAAGRRARREAREASVARWRGILEALASQPDGARAADDQEARHALKLLRAALGRSPTGKDLAAAAGRVRMQYGTSSRFRAGLARSGRYLPHIRTVLAAEALPLDLAYLPHVESSFHPGAASHAGAAGLWQFIRPTARRYLRVDEVVDARLDPYEATRGAARLLADNHAALGTWPVALTAYNHGRGGMLRAVASLGTDDIVRIVEAYDGRTFGFASRNFYAQFLAARRVARTPEQYFERLERPQPPALFAEVELPFYVELGAIERHLGIQAGDLTELNASLRPPVWDGTLRVPAGYRLRLPLHRGVTGPAAGLLARIPRDERHAEQREHVVVHVVRPGESLSTVAARFGVGMRYIARMNEIDDVHRIYAGQRLKVPRLP